MGIEARLNRLLGASGNCLDVAIDHGAFNEVSFLSGIEDMHKAIATVFQASPDAIQVTPGQAEILQSKPGRDKPALVMRSDIANIYGNKLPRSLFSKLIDEAVEQALRWDAACVVVNLLLLPDQPDLHHACIDNISRLKPVCVRYGMPLMVEPLVMKDNATAGGYMVDGDLKKILPLVRQAVELGADLIKADPCDDVKEYHRVIQIARKPVLVRGGGRAEDKEVLERSVELMKQGARGLVYGRNIIQHPKPAGMTKALMAIVHEQADATVALGILNGSAT
jgi:DhnA family fructose-bisphosphate aldolase class Ia